MSFTAAMTGSGWMMSKKADVGSNCVGIAGERRREVEAEAVDVHVLDPVAQAVQDELRARAARRMLSELPRPV